MPNSKWGNTGASVAATPSLTDVVPGTSTSSAWGSITGTLSAQTDLMTKFALYALLTGATFTGALAGTSASFSGAVSMGALTATGASLYNASNAASILTIGNPTGGQSSLDFRPFMNTSTWANPAQAQIRAIDAGVYGGRMIFATKQNGSIGAALTDALTIWENQTATFVSSVTMGALTATSETISGLATWNGGGSLAAGYGIAIGDGAPGGTTGKLYSVATNQLMWNGSLILTLGNVGTNAATLQAAVASATAPKVGTYAQMVAWSVPAGWNPYWYATDDVNTNDSTIGALYQWGTPTAGVWNYINQPQTVVPKITAGVISAGAVGAQAIAADVALIGQVLRSTGFTAGTTTAAPTGFKMSGTAFTSYCYNGDTTGIYSTSLSSYMEIGSGCSLGGYALGSLVLGRLINAGMKVYSPGTYTWVCPPGITQVVVTLSGGGGSGCHDASNPGAGGGAGCLTVISSVTPGTSYTVVCGAGGAGTSTTSGNDGGNSTFNGLTAQGGAAGHTGGGGYGGGAGPLGQMTSGNGVMAQMATGAVYIMCGQGARGGGGGTDPGSTQWQTGTGFGVGGGSSAAGPGYGSGSDGKTSGSTAAGGQGVVILSW